jgi:uncharacterized protein YndB with AHSA1/START domain
MYEIEVLAEIHAPIAKVFEALSDHEGFFRNHGVRRSVVTTPGKTEKNGLGAVRTIDALSFRFVEEIVRFERPARFDYLIRSMTLYGRKLPMEHELGWLELTESKGGTKVAWRSRFTIGVPVIGDRLARLIGPQAERAFGKLMKQAKRELEREHAAARAS